MFNMQLVEEIGDVGGIFSWNHAAVIHSKKNINTNKYTNSGSDEFVYLNFKMERFKFGDNRTQF